MKHLAFSTAALLALTLMGGCSNNNTTTDTNTTTPDPNPTSDPTPTPALSCTTSFGTPPTAEQLAAYAGEYVSIEGTRDQNTFEFTPNGNDVLVTFSDAGLLTYNGVTYTATQTCFVDNTDVPDNIYLEFESGSHIDLFPQFQITGESPANVNISIESTVVF